LLFGRYETWVLNLCCCLGRLLFWSIKFGFEILVSELETLFEALCESHEAFRLETCYLDCCLGRF
jgi:hypothetical protein